MPEGDTIHKIARRVGPRLAARSVGRLFMADLGEVLEAKGWVIESVEALGKHLLILFDAPWVLRTHLGMKGRVFLREDAKPVGNAVFQIVTNENSPVSLLCVRAYRAELIKSSSLPRHPRLAPLGPDLLSSTVDLGQIVRRLREPSFADRSLAEVLLDQRVAAGLGNVYKSELLFMARLPPTVMVRDLSDDVVRWVYAEAVRLLRLNLKTRFRTTVPTQRRPTPTSPRLWVYGRGGKPCLECGTLIERFSQGDMARGTWFCPSCQARSDESSLDASPFRS